MPAGASKRARPTAATPKPFDASRANKSSRHLFTVKPGGIAGYLGEIDIRSHLLYAHLYSASLSGNASYVDIRAKTDVYVGFLPSHALERLLEKKPIVLLTLSKRLISLLSPLGELKTSTVSRNSVGLTDEPPIVLHIDASLDWVQVNAGQVMWRPGEASDSFYIVINGRLRALADKEAGGVEIVGEFGQGDTVGELDVITGATRRTTMHAIRDTELARMPVTLFNAISLRCVPTQILMVSTSNATSRHPQITAQ